MQVPPRESGTLQSLRSAPSLCGPTAGGVEVNTSLKGSSYERAYKRYLKSQGYDVGRARASLGVFDLFAIHGHPVSELLLVQCKNIKRLGCVAAGRLAVKLRLMDKVPVFATVVVVHPHGKVMFCEH